VTGNRLARQSLRNDALNHRHPAPDDPGFRSE
jgi:hypothetical protein